MNEILFSPNFNVSGLVNKYVTKPQKGSLLIPEWFKNAPRYQNNESTMRADSGYHNLTVRHCMPFIDSLTSGYFFTTWTDIYVQRVNGKPVFFYEDVSAVEEFGYGIIQYQENFQSHIHKQHGYDSFLYAWSTYWRIQTPKGISCLFTHPLNRTDLPFITLSGIMDTDNWHGSDVLNFALQENFEGIIPKGTPYVQIIPFRREEYDMKILDVANEDIEKQRSVVNNYRYNDLKTGYYRDNLWENKKY